jgi:hypothetical protein
MVVGPRVWRLSLLLDLGRAAAFACSILSLYALMATAFFAQGTRWEERLAESLARIVVAAGVCFASGLVFRISERTHEALTKTLPVRLFLWTLLGYAVLFVLAWYLDEYYVPLIWKNLPY